MEQITGHRFHPDYYGPHFLVDFMPRLKKTCASTTTLKRQFNQSLNIFSTGNKVDIFLVSEPATNNTTLWGLFMLTESILQILLGLDLIKKSLLTALSCTLPEGCVHGHSSI